MVILCVFRKCLSEVLFFWLSAGFTLVKMTVINKNPSRCKKNKQDGCNGDNAHSKYNEFLIGATRKRTINVNGTDNTFHLEHNVSRSEHPSTIPNCEKCHLSDQFLPSSVSFFNL
ncbi:hypothetical protein Trydic_g11402 [Trypoxylus dichotomus]